MEWVQRVLLSKKFADSPFRVGHIFNSPLLIVKSWSGDAQPSWRRSGTLFPIFNFGIDQFEEGVGRWAYLRTKVLKFESLGQPFDLEFRSIGWLKSVNLAIWEPKEPISEISPEEIRQALSDLNDKVEGETVSLTWVSSIPFTEGAITLYRSTYEGRTKYADYEVGRFRTGEQILSDPVVTVAPGRFTATFTTKDPLPDNALSVWVRSS